MRLPISVIGLCCRRQLLASPRTLFTRPVSTRSLSMAEESTLRFELSTVPLDPLGGGRHIRTAAALIIGDEVLNGKTRDTNSAHLARFCFAHGVDLKRVEVIPDEEDDIVEASRRLAGKYDFVVTSGGIGPTHDDITYEALAKAFDTSLEPHAEALRRLDAASTARRGPQNRTPEQQAAFARMALLPATAEVLFVQPELGVPVVRLAGKLCVLPGVPHLFERLLAGLTAYLPLPPPDARPLRLQIFTKQPESGIAPFLTALQARVRSEDIRVGSYPRWSGGVHVSLIGREHERVRVLADEVARELEGELVEPTPESPV